MSIIKNVVSLQDHHLTWQRGYQEPEHEKFQELIKNKKFSTTEPKSNKNQEIITYPPQTSNTFK